METERIGAMRITVRWGSTLILLAASALPWAVAAPQEVEAPPAESATRAWLGVWLSDAVDGGVEVIAVAPGGPAQKAGLTRGDVLLEVDGEPVRGEQMLGRLLLQRSPGDPLELIVLRGSASVRTRVELGERRPAAPALPSVPDPPRSRWKALSEYERARVVQTIPIGLQVVVVTPALRAHFGAPERSGVLVTRVEPGKLAAQAGISVGDLLLSIDGTEIDDPRVLSELLSTWNRAEPLRATIVRGQEPQTVSISATRPAQAWLEAAQEARKEQHAREREMLEHRLALEIERLERRIEELKRELERLRDER